MGGPPSAAHLPWLSGLFSSQHWGELSGAELSSFCSCSTPGVSSPQEARSLPVGGQTGCPPALFDGGWEREVEEGLWENRPENLNQLWGGHRRDFRGPEAQQQGPEGKDDSGKGTEAGEGCGGHSRSGSRIAGAGSRVPSTAAY